MHLDQDTYRKGIEYLKQAIKVNPNHEGALRRLGKVFMENQYYPEALIYLTKAVQLKPEDDDLLYQLAFTQFHLELYNQSFDTNRKALRQNKRNASAKYLKTMFKNEHVRKMRKQFPAK
jgi:tetratricopeptide (TPR) repeat protein